MPFKITLQCLDEATVLPLSYQYELSAWIYGIIEQADAGYAAFLHQRGYESGVNKSFKLFCFSQIEAAQRRVEGDRLHILSREATLHIAFYVERAAEEFLRGLFQSQQFRIGDYISQARFAVKSIEMTRIQWPPTGAPVRVRLKSPLVLSRKRADGRTDEYLAPDDPEYGALFFQNLLDKFRAATGHAPPAFWDAQRFGLISLTPEPKSKLITIKKGKLSQTRVRGWFFQFEIDAPRELIELGLLAGFGKENAQGFGYGELL